VANVSVLEVAPEEVKAAILLFYSLLDEQQRRLYAGLESLKLGRGGDRQLADFLDLDPHTVARGRQQLLAQDVEVDRAPRAGAGRKHVEKNARNNRCHRDSFGARYRRRSHHRAEVDAQNHPPADRYSRLSQEVQLLLPPESARNFCFFPRIKAMLRRAPQIA
jgi:hypothetical protein